MEPKDFDNDRIKHYERLEENDRVVRELSKDLAKSANVLLFEFALWSVCYFIRLNSQTLIIS